MLIMEFHRQSSLARAVLISLAALGSRTALYGAAVEPWQFIDATRLSAVAAAVGYLSFHEAFPSGVELEKITKDTLKTG